MNHKFWTHTYFISFALAARAFFGQSPQQLVIFLLPEQKKNETKRKFAGCIFLPTPVIFSAKQKELAIAQTSFARAAGLFISFARTKETKQRKFAGCIFLPTPVFFYAKQKELAIAQTSFLFLTLRKAPALYGKKKRPELLVFATLLRSLICCARFFCNFVSLVACWF